MLPTFCQLAGVTPPPDIDGMSIMPELMGKPQSQAKHEYLYWEFYEKGGRRAVRFGDWKAIQQNLNNDPSGPIELYYLPSDLGEETNVAVDHPELIAKALHYFNEAHTPSPYWAFGKPVKGKKPSGKKPAA
jgi:arylsulfatase A-like enzyme